MKTATTTVAHLLETACQVALDAIFPPRCAGCGVWSGELFCAACRATLRPIAAPFCARCGLPFNPLAHAADLCADCRPNRYHAAPPFDMLRSPYAFEGALRHAVHRFKYQGKIALAAPLAALLDEFLKTQNHPSANIPRERLALLVPVPLHSWRRYRRGYNQSGLLARELGRRLDVPVADALRRVRHTAPQVELSARDRAANVRGAFAINAGFDAAPLHGDAVQSPGAVLLIDDVCTTGATLRECTRVLKQAGAPEVYALTLAR
jgi:ComF family protein